ncbi:MAG: FAD-dependent oxidoreductase [Candidatus Marinimicrobia bacterium]|nr:FAD-dependent oxidoreductase [Candidatus Neomarinimicrobiota bacterium]
MGTADNTFKNFIRKHEKTVSFSDKPDIQYPIGIVDPSPCMEACPAGVNVKAYVSLIAAGKFHEALNVVRERNPLPGICGRVCTHPCETYCNRNQIDSPVAIRSLKRFVADYELEHPMPKPNLTAGTRKEKIAIIGSGPAGLTAAHDLAKSGFNVTIFEELSVPGGMLIAGIPSYRMPRDILKIEIDYIRNLGVNIITNKKISGKQDYNKLLKDFDAVYLAIGAHIGKKLGIPGEDNYKGFLDAVTFLREVNLEKPKKPGEKVIVIGGGNSAIDAARTALRLGSEVNIVYRRTQKEMPADEDEIKEAEKEGVKMHYLAAPVKIIGANGNVTGLECTKMKLGKPDKSGRARPIPINNSEFIIEADVIIPAISQQPDLSFLPKDHNIDISRWNTFAADENTMATNIPGIFAGGDAVTGPNTVIDAIAQGHITATSIERFINGEKLEQTDSKTKSIETEIKIDFNNQLKTKRAIIPMQEISERQNSFQEVEYGFDEATAIAEAQRCLRCGPCGECFICVSDCNKGLSVLHSVNGHDDYVLRLPSDFQSKDDLANGNLLGTIKTANGKGIPIELDSYIPIVKENLCRGCGDCVTVCEYNACQLVQKNGDIFISHIDQEICRGCGTCVTFCPSSAIQPGRYTSDWLSFKFKNIDPKKRNIVVFSCNWNGADFEKVNTSKYKNTNFIFIQTMCTGRIESTFILRAIEEGTDGVLVVGCSADECHYEFGAKRFAETYAKVEQLAHILGYEKYRIKYETISGKNTDKFVEVVNNYARKFK